MLQVQKRIQEGFTIIELLIVIAIIGILATLVLTNFQGAQAKGRDTVRKTDINSLYQKLEEYYNDNGGYPDGALDGLDIDGQAVLVGTDEGVFTDEDGAGIGYTDGFVLSTAEPTLAPADTGGNEYIYGAYGCTTAGAQTPVGATCSKYKLSAALEREADNYEKKSLN